MKERRRRVDKRRRRRRQDIRSEARVNRWGLRGRRSVVVLLFTTQPSTDNYTIVLIVPHLIQWKRFAPHAMLLVSCDPTWEGDNRDNPGHNIACNEDDLIAQSENRSDCKVNNKSFWEFNSYCLILLFRTILNCNGNFIGLLFMVNCLN